jgi:hypothetical protein
MHVEKDAFFNVNSRTGSYPRGSCSRLILVKKMAAIHIFVLCSSTIFDIAECNLMRYYKSDK